MAKGPKGADVSINTVTKLLVDAGTVAAAYHDQNVRGLQSKRVQCDEIWSFCYAKKANVKDAKAAPEGAGDVPLVRPRQLHLAATKSSFKCRRPSLRQDSRLCDWRDNTAHRTSESPVIGCCGGRVQSMPP
jgi:hypothetical protein